MKHHTSPQIPEELPVPERPAEIPGQPAPDTPPLPVVPESIPPEKPFVPPLKEIKRPDRQQLRTITRGIFPSTDL